MFGIFQLSSLADINNLALICIRTLFPKKRQMKLVGVLMDCSTHNSIQTVYKKIMENVIGQSHQFYVFT